MTVTSPIDAQAALRALTQEVGRAVYGAEDHVRLTFLAVMVRGHVLYEGVPGTGKTFLARTLSHCLGLELRRLQCTPDLMPGDVLGANIFDFRTQSFHLTRGPIFTDILLADEINRTPPKTQSALLEAMQERSVTIDGTTHPLTGRFTVIATQNPVEQEGTYPLPEAQLDRFLFKLDIGYPSAQQELAAVMAHGSSGGMPDAAALGLAKLADPATIDALREVPGTVHLDARVAEYVVALARATRNHPSLTVGLSPRAATMLAAAARASAACEGRDYTLPDDVKSLFLPLARHRVIVTTAAEMEDVKAEQVLREVIAQVPAPR